MPAPNLARPSAPPAASTEAVAASSAPSTPPKSAAPATAEPAAANLRLNPLRSSTLIGIAPVVPAQKPSSPPLEPTSGTQPALESAAEAQAERVQEPAARVQEPASPSELVVGAATSSAKPIAALPTPEAAFARPTAPAPSDLPPSSTAATETSAPVISADEPEFRPKRGGVSIALLAAAGLAIGVLGYRYLHRSAPPPEIAALAVQPVAPSPRAASPSADSVPASAPAHEPAPSATAADFAAAPPAPLDAPAAAKSAEPAPSAEPAAGTTRVTITTTPPKAKFFHYGKEVGTSPFVVDLAPGEKHAYEVWLPGHITRKVVVDGTKTEISVGLREE